MMNAHRLFRTILFAASLAAAAAVAANAQEPKVLRVVPQSDLKILDPIWTTAFVTRNHGYNIYDTLFGMDDDGKMHPQMVDSYTVSPDGKTWVFTLRKGLLFHDDAPVTSNDVIASLKRWAQRDSLGQRMFGAMDKIEPIGDQRVRMVFKDPFGMVMQALGKPSSNPPFIMPARVAATPADKQIDDTTGSGPFIFSKSEYRPGEKVVYLKNPKYVPRAEPPSGTAGGKRVNVDRLEWIILKDAQTQANAMARGEVDMIEWVPPEQYAALKAMPGVVLDGPIKKSSFALHLNHVQPPFDNPKIAQAAFMAINQEALMRAQVVDKELYNTCASIYPCGTGYASADTGYFTGKPQFAKARELLKEAGYDGKPVVLLYPADFAVLNKLSPVMAQLLKQAGFNVDMQSMDWPTLVTRRAKKDPVDKGGWNVFITGWSLADNINPMYLASLSGNGEKGWFGWATAPKLEELKSAFMAESDEAKRKAIATSIQKEAYASGILAPIGEYKPKTAYAQSVSGVVRSPVPVFWGIQKK